MKKYKAIFFDWDGTAVENRISPADDVAKIMAKLLDRGIYLFIISGTTYKNLAGGRLHEHFTVGQRRYLYLGLARGAYNYGFDENGGLAEITDSDIGKEKLLKIHDVSYAIHRHLLENYSYVTDIIFDRPNYCKIDIMNGSSRQNSLYLSGNEIEDVKAALERSGYRAGLAGLMELAAGIGRTYGIEIKPTCDAKYLEVGVSNKSDNVNAFMTRVLFPAGIGAEECAFWGDEFLELDGGIWGSDSFMITPLTSQGDFFDVGMINGKRPENVTHVQGSTARFLEFIAQQAL